MIDLLPPAMILLLGALLIGPTRGRLRTAVVLAAPLLTLVAIGVVGLGGRLVLGHLDLGVVVGGRIGRLPLLTQDQQRDHVEEERREEPAEDREQRVPGGLAPDNADKTRHADGQHLPDDRHRHGVHDIGEVAPGHLPAGRPIRPCR